MKRERKAVCCGKPMSECDCYSRLAKAILTPAARPSPKYGEFLLGSTADGEHMVYGSGSIKDSIGEYSEGYVLSNPDGTRTFYPLSDYDIEISINFKATKRED